MAEFNWNAPDAIATVMTTELNALTADDRNITGTAVTNLSSLDMYADFELYLSTQAVARDAAAFVAMYILPRVDETNYPYGDGALDPASNLWVANFLFDAAVTARRTVVRGVLLPPESFHIILKNVTGQDFAATLNTLKIRRYNTKSG